MIQSFAVYQFYGLHAGSLGVAGSIDLVANRPAERALGTARDDFKRIALRNDPGDHLRDLLRV